MLTLPTAIMALVEPFRPVFYESTWHKVQVLLVGAILAPGKRTVTSALRAVGLADEPGFGKYHQVLNRNACPACSFLLGDFGGSFPVPQASTNHSTGGLVCQTLADFCRCSRRGQTSALISALDFSHVAFATRYC
jgi:hypothetical protein